MAHPVIIQGGMGVAVSHWKLARAVSREGALGVVAGTALASVLSRRLECGDPTGEMRRALSHFPIPAMAERVLARFFIPGGKPASTAFTLTPMPVDQPGPALTELTVVASFAEVFLAKSGHDGVVGLNLLEKIQLPTLASLYGAMLAGVDYVLMGAGIPRSIPGTLDRLAVGEAVEQKLDVAGAAPGQDFFSHFDPAAFFGGPAPKLRRPFFLAVIASATLAMTLARKSNGRVDGFIVEGELAGGHNAPPRGPLELDAQGEPVYGPRDVPDLTKIRELGLPFWLAGSQARPEKLAEALRLGAAGIQVGTLFAFCDESGIASEIKQSVIAASRTGTARVFTDPAASPTGFPFKVVDVPGTLSAPDVYAARTKICDLGYLRQMYVTPEGKLGYRCAGEPLDAYLRKGGNLAETTGRKCLCNGLMATAGLGQPRAAGIEPAIVTAGNEVADLARILGAGSDHYGAEDVLRYLRSAAA
jgi:nitronate monooxygenase